MILDFKTLLLELVCLICFDVLILAHECNKCCRSQKRTHKSMADHRGMHQGHIVDVAHSRCKCRHPIPSRIYRPQLAPEYLPSERHTHHVSHRRQDHNRGCRRELQSSLPRRNSHGHVALLRHRCNRHSNILAILRKCHNLNQSSHRSMCRFPGHHTNHYRKGQFLLLYSQLKQVLKISNLIITTVGISIGLTDITEATCPSHFTDATQAYLDHLIIGVLA